MQMIDKEEAQEVESIIFDYFVQETGSETEAQLMMERLANMLQDPGIKLIHLGNTVFMMILAAPRVAEIHTMTTKEDSSSLAKNFVALSNFLKNIGVLRAYTYTDDPRFMAVAKRTRLPFQVQEVPGKNGNTLTVYSMEYT
jgi:hypothetical protein